MVMVMVMVEGEEGDLGDEGEGEEDLVNPKMLFWSNLDLCASGDDGDGGDRGGRRGGGRGFGGRGGGGGFGGDGGGKCALCE